MPHQPKHPQPSRLPIRWFESLHFRFSLLQFCLLVLVIGITITVMVTVERQLLLEQGYVLAEQLGNSLVSELEERTILAETLATSLANLGESLEHDPGKYMSIVPHLIDYEGEQAFIAGGGIWPEPNAFTAGVERRSFFWGRDPKGVLQYFDDYNDPKGVGYHNEEWYVPATYYPPGRAFWSKSYMDPYSYQPMVTCTVPMHEQGKVTGVATVDVKLEGLGAFFEKSSKLLGGYIFSVDRNNKFLSFPKPEMAKSYTPDDKGKIVEEFLTVREFAKKHPTYQVIADALDEINEKMIRSARLSPGYRADLAKEIDERSYQINREEAELSVAILNTPAKDTVPQLGALKVERMFIGTDPLLKQKVMVSIFQMPATHWKIVIITPSSKFFAVADEATKKVASYIVLLEFFAFLVIFFILRRLFIKPLRRMATRVKRISETDGVLKEKLDESSRHELGDLAYEFNRRTDQLVSALERIDRSKDILEERVVQRTAELEKAKTSFQNILDTASDGIVSIDENQNIILFNQRAQEIFGYSMKEVLGKPLEVLLPKRFRDGHREHVQGFGRSSLVSKLMSDRPDLFGCRKNGEEFPVVISISKVVMGRQFIFTAIIRDITKEKRLEEMVLQSEKMSAVGQLAGGVAHDFNNLLTVILGHIEFLRATPELDPGLVDSIDEIQRSAKRAEALTKQLLAFSRKQILQLKVSDLSEIVRGADKMVRRLLGENIEFVTILGEDLPKVKVDASQIEQVITNLAVNARDSMPKGGKLILEISTEKVDSETAARYKDFLPGDYVRITVTDTGIGMSPETQAHIFEPFFTTKELGKGTGLGLATVYGIVKQLHGYIRVDSQPGKGTTFVIYLPPSNVQETVEVARPASVLPTGSETILLVEDEELVRGLALKALTRQGFRVLEARNGLEAVSVDEKHEGEPIRLLVTDMVMPYMGGSELAEKFSARHPGVMIIFASGYSDHSAVQKWLDKGHRFLQKPYTPTELLQIVRSALDLGPVV